MENACKEQRNKATMQQRNIRNKQSKEQRRKMPVKSETTGVSFDELDKMFNVTEEKRKNIEAFKGKPMIAMPKVGDKKGIVVRPRWSKDESGNPTPVLIVKVDSPKMKSADKSMKLMTVEDFEDQGVEYSMPYGASLHYSFIRETTTRGWKFEDIFNKWWKITAEEYENPKAVDKGGIATAYRATYREDLNAVVNSSQSRVATQF